MRYYAGIGSRRTPKDVLNLMTLIAINLKDSNHTLRTGHAPGADQAFELGAKEAAEIFLPWATFEDDHKIYADPENIYRRPSPQAIDMAAKYHPAWDRCSPGAKLLHARNCHQILGPKLDDPVDFVICWRIKSGGTDQAIRIASDWSVPVSNLADFEDRSVAEIWLEEK